jgi:acetyltransferase-like isoleucine patch superfamily enzyme
MIIKLIVLFLPWPLRRRLLESYFGYKISPSAKIGLAWVYPSSLCMEAGARIDHFTVVIHLDEVRLGENASIGRSNWITGFPGGGGKHFSHQPSRVSRLQLGAHSAITKQHHIDCTNEIEIGCFTTIAGYRSQFLTHSINLRENRQDSVPIRIGSYCFVGTNCVILGGGALPDRSVLGAKTLLNKGFEENDCLYAGVPARKIKRLEGEIKYFERTSGYVL